MSAPLFGIDYYWLHQRPDGVIEKLPNRPHGKRALYVRLMEKYEEVRTEDRLVALPFIQYFSVEPPGDGWRKNRREHDDMLGWVTHWRRPRR